MSGMIDVSHLDLWYKVNHPNFDTSREYKAIAFTSFSESGWDWLTFITEKGHTYSVVVKHCMCVSHDDYHRQSTTLMIPSPPTGGDSYLQDLE